MPDLFPMQIYVRDVRSRPTLQLPSSANYSHSLDEYFAAPSLSDVWIIPYAIYTHGVKLWRGEFIPVRKSSHVGCVISNVFHLSFSHPTEDSLRRINSSNLVITGQRTNTHTTLPSLCQRRRYTYLSTTQRYTPDRTPLPRRRFRIYIPGISTFREHSLTPIIASPLVYPR